MFMAEPVRASNSFVGTEEYIAPVCYSLDILYIIIEQQKTTVQYAWFKYVFYCVECTN